MRNRTNFFRANHENEVKAQRSEKLPIRQKNVNLCLLDSVEKEKGGQANAKSYYFFFRANHENEIEAQRSEKLTIKQKCQPLFTCLCRKYCTGYKNSVENNRRF